MKVKKFRIRPRLPTVKRNLKSLLGLKQLPAETEDALPKEADQLFAHVIPTVFYKTWSLGEMPNSFQGLLGESVGSRTVSVSALVATVGPSPDQELARLAQAQETNRSALITVLSEEALDLSFQFLIKLLVEDAKQDDCEIGDPFMVEGEEPLSQVLEALGADQEGVRMDSSRHVSPRFTRVALVSWVPVSKKKKQGLVVKKR